MRYSPWGHKESDTTEQLHIHDIHYVSSLVAQTVKNLPAKQKMRAQSLGREDLLEKEMATHSSILAWKILWTEKPGRLRSLGSQESDTTSFSLSF